MADLYPTKTRLALLDDVAAGDVHEMTWPPRASYQMPAAGGRKVTAQCRELERAGWIELGDELPGSRRPWRLTDAGRAILDTHHTTTGATS